MKQRLAYIVFFLAPIIPVIFYVIGAQAGFDGYGVSVVFGVYAFVLVCNQFYLATQPSFLLKLLSAKQIRNLHMSSPLVLLVLACAHLSLKLIVGFTLSTTQAIVGLAAFILFVLGVFSAMLLFANTLLTRKPAFTHLKNTIYSKTGLNLQKTKRLHTIMVPASLLILAHMLLASTSDFTYNPWGTAILTAWMVFCLLSYLTYWLRGRKHKGTKR